MRVLLIAATYPPTRCGVGDYSRRLGRELVGRGITVDVLTGHASDEEHAHGDPNDERSVGARPPRREVPPPSFVAQADGVGLARAVEDWDFGLLDLVAATLRTRDYDVLSLQYHGEDYGLHPAVCGVVDVAREFGLPVVTTFHNLQQPRPWSEGDDPLGHLLDHSAGWISTNTIDQRRLREHAGAPQRLRVIPAGPCLTAVGDPVRHAHDATFSLAYFGFLNPFKGIEYLLRAVASLRDRGADLSLTLAAGIHTDAPGRLCRYAEFIDDEIARLELGPVLERHGYLPDEEVSEILLRSHLAVFPFREGLSGKNTSFWSAMHHATPTLTTRGEGLPAGLVDGENTLLVRPDDEELLAERIAWAMEHRDELGEIGRRGREYVLRDFDWGKLTNDMLAAFAAARRPGASRAREGGRS